MQKNVAWNSTFCIYFAKECCLHTTGIHHLGKNCCLIAHYILVGFTRASLFYCVSRQSWVSLKYSIPSFSSFHLSRCGSRIALLLYWRIEHLPYPFFLMAKKFRHFELVFKNKIIMEAQNLERGSDTTQVQMCWELYICLGDMKMSKLY